MKASKYYSLNFKKRPFQVFALSAIALFVLSFFSDKSVEININDTYVIIWPGVIYRVLSGFLLLIWLLYLFIKKRLLSKKLIWAHLFATVLPVIAATIYYNVTQQNSLQTSNTSYWAIYSLLLFITVSAQFVLIVNIAGGMVKRLTRKRGKILVHDNH